MATYCSRTLLARAHLLSKASAANKSFPVKEWECANNIRRFRRCRTSDTRWASFRSFSSIDSNEQQQTQSCSDSTTTSLSTLPGPDCSTNAEVSASITDMSSSFWTYTNNQSSLLATQSHASVEELQWYNINGYVMDLVHFTHDVTGLSYASSIMAITVGIRLFVILPIGIMSLRIDPTIEEDIQKLKKRIERPISAAERNALMVQQKELNQRAKRQTWIRIGMPFASLGTFFLMWSGLRYMAVYYPQDLAQGGMLWFTDLTQRDPLLFLPVLSAFAFIMMGEVNADELGKPMRKFSPKWRYVWRIFRASSLCFLWNAPAAIFCYWLPNSAMSLAQAMILSQPPVRRALGIMPKEKRIKAKEANAIQFVDKDSHPSAAKGRKNTSSGNDPQISLPRKKKRNASKRKS